MYTSTGHTCMCKLQDMGDLPSRVRLWCAASENSVDEVGKYVTADVLREDRGGGYVVRLESSDGTAFKEKPVPSKKCYKVPTNQVLDEVRMISNG